MPFFVPVIIKPDLSCRNDLLSPQQFFHPAELLLVQRADLIRVHADHPVDKRILFRELQDFVPGFHRSRSVYDRAHAACCHSAQKLFSVCIKLLIVIVSMCVKYHMICVLSMILRGVQCLRASALVTFYPAFHGK